jgi:molybdopterin converting factor small subunit
MAVTVRIPAYLANLAGKCTCISLSPVPGTVREALEVLWTLHPALRDRIVDEQGAVRQHVNIFVGNQCIRFADGLSTKLTAGAELLIVPAVSGGRKSFEIMDFGNFGIEI